VERRLRLEPAAAEGRAAPREADVARDRDEPGRLGMGDDAPLERTEGVQERRLEGILGVLAVAEAIEAERVDLLGVALEQPLRVVSRRPPGVICSRSSQGRVAGRGRDGNPYETFANSLLTALQLAGESDEERLESE